VWKTASKFADFTTNIRLNFPVDNHYLIEMITRADFFGWKIQR
jgi:hypothetical protein